MKLILICLCIKLFICNQPISSQNNTTAEDINICIETVIGNKHGHVFDCDMDILFTSNENTSTIVSGTFKSSGSIKITPNGNSIKIVPILLNHDSSGRLTHTKTHIKKIPPIGGRFMTFKNKQTKLVFPNPAKDKITINTTNTLKSIIIYNLYGNEVVKENNPNQKNEKPTIDITQLNNGFYTIKLLFANGLTKTETLIKN